MQTDYFVKGCGASAMAFVDSMLSATDATFTLVDKRPAPGGHWNDAYPFVRLHQPSACYGVPSRPLGHLRKDTVGFNKGFYELASGLEVADYFHQVMRDTFVASGRVTFHPMCEVVQSDANSAEFVSLLSGERRRVEIKKKFVDATVLETSIPLTHARQFEVGEEVTCIAPNDLARFAPKHSRFTVLGAGKTAIDSVLWLLANGAKPASISWVLPRDPWLINREHLQPGEEFLEQCLASFASQYEICARATSLRELSEQMEAKQIWMRLDTSVWPTMMHGATVNTAELSELRRIGHFIRGQRVRRLERGRIILDRDTVDAHGNELFIDCTARALAANVNDRRPVFAPGVIRLQMIRQYQPTFSAALIGRIEATVIDESEKQRLTQISSMTDTIADWARAIAASMMNQGAWSANNELSAWIAGCRLELFGGPIRRISPNDAVKQALVAKFREHAGAAVRNLLKLAETG